MTMLIVKPMAFAALSASRGTGAANLVTPDPKEVFVDTVTGSALQINIDLGTTTPWDTLALVGVNVVGDTYGITGGASYTAETYLEAGASQFQFQAGARPPATSLYHNAGGHSGRYIRVTLARTAGLGTLTIGGVIVGKAFKPEWNPEWGSGRGVFDTGTKQRLRSGGFGIARGAKVPTYQWTLGDLSDDELAALYDLATDVGETDPILVVEDVNATTRLDRGIHYGLFSRFDAYERQDPNLNRWALSLERWL